MINSDLECGSSWVTFGSLFKEKANYLLIDKQNNFKMINENNKKIIIDNNKNYDTELLKSNYYMER